MDPIKEALTFDDVTLAPNYSEILPSDVNTTTFLSKKFKLKIKQSRKRHFIEDTLAYLSLFFSAKTDHFWLRYG